MRALIQTKSSTSGWSPWSSLTALLHAACAGRRWSQLCSPWLVCGTALTCRPSSLLWVWILLKIVGVSSSLTAAASAGTGMLLAAVHHSTSFGTSVLDSSCISHTGTVALPVASTVESAALPVVSTVGSVARLRTTATLSPAAAGSTVMHVLECDQWFVVGSTVVHLPDVVHWVG